MTPVRDDEDDDDDWDDDAVAGDADDDAPTVPCPYCRREIVEDTPRCPHCERYLSAEDHAGAGRPTWVVVTALLCLGAAIWWTFRFLG